MIRIRSLVFSVLFIVWTLALGLMYLPLLAVPRRLTTMAATFWLKGTLLMLRLICGLRYQVRGPIPQGAALIASKHQSTLETYVFRLLLSDPAVILKQELLRIPIFGWYLGKTGVIAIDRSAGAKALKAMVKGAEEAVAAQRQVLIFPEGTRTAIGQEPDYHSGVAMLYGALNQPCIPVAVNSGLFWGRQSMDKQPGVATIQFLDPIPPGLNRKEFMAELQSRVEAGTQALVAEAQAEFSHLPSCG